MTTEDSTSTISSSSTSSTQETLPNKSNTFVAHLLITSALNPENLHATLVASMTPILSVVIHCPNITSANAFCTSSVVFLSMHCSSLLPPSLYTQRFIDLMQIAAVRLCSVHLLLMLLKGVSYLKISVSNPELWLGYCSAFWLVVGCWHQSAVGQLFLFRDSSWKELVLSLALAIIL